MSNTTEHSGQSHEFHIVGIGASAGGLEPLEVFFKTLPTDTGMAFVVVQHLSPDFKSHMAELLARQTKMSIRRVEDGMEVKPNSIYLIPPKTEMTIADGKLLLSARDNDRLSHPIDIFFRSLASDVGARAVAVVLSGTGSDGSRGIIEVHKAGGLVLAQDETTAKFDSMLVNAQATGLVDAVMPPAEIAEALVRYVKENMTAQQLKSQALISAAKLSGVDRAFQLLREMHGLDFSHYKLSTVGRRIQRRIDLLGTSSLASYLEELETNATELNELYKDLLIGVTKFFRDAEAFVILENVVLPRLIARRVDDDPIRMWVAGCASGEEAYSIAMLVDEELKRRKLIVDVKVFATDAHHDSLNFAAKGVYPAAALSEITEERRKKYFREKRDGFHVIPEIRKHVIFAPHNLLNDAPFTQMDLISCRNLLIYLESTAQRKAFATFHFALKKDGILFLGPSETPGEYAKEFDEIDKRWRLYSKTRNVRLPLETPIMVQKPTTSLPRAAFPGARTASNQVDQSLLRTYDRLLEQRMPPSILVDSGFDILHVFGDAADFIRGRQGRPTNNVLELVDERLRASLSSALQHSLRKKDSVRYTGIQLNSESDADRVEIVVQPIYDQPTQLTTLLIELVRNQAEMRNASEAQIVDVHSVTHERVVNLESELQLSQENLQATIEEMETANEELQASNEELVASNEELQSTNEELHSVNEELFTVNAEHQRRVEELAQANADMDNLLAATRVGVIYLDDELFIRRYTPEIGRVFHVAPQDVGRSIENFKHTLKYELLVDDLREVLELRKEKEVNVQDHYGAEYLLRMHPYNSDNENVDGLVMTLIDISKLRKAQAELELFRFMSETTADMHSLIDRDGRFVYVNPAMCKLTGYVEEELLGKTVMDVDTVYDLARLQNLFDRATHGTIGTFETEQRRKDGTVFPAETTVSTILTPEKRLLFSCLRDISQRRQDEQTMRIQHLAIDSATNGILITDATRDDHPVVYANAGFCELTGYEIDEIEGRNCRILQGELSDSESVATIRNAVANEEACRVTLLNYRKDGTPFWNDLQITPVHDEHGRLVNFIGIQHDITAHKAIHEKLQKANDQINHILESINDGFVFLDDDWRFKYVNGVAGAMLNMAPTNLLGQVIWDVMPALKDIGFAKKCETAKATGRFDCFEHFLDPIDRWFEYRCYPSDEGMSVFFLDTTVQRSTLRRLKKSESKARRLATVVEQCSDFIGIATPDGTAIYVNAAGLQMVGLGVDTDVSKTTITDYISPEHQSIISQTAIPALKRTGRWKGPIDFRNFKTGAMIPTLWNAFKIEDPEGDIPEIWVTISPDLTDQKKMQESLRESERRANQANRAKSEFLANMSHELRTPMTAVLGFADILQMEAEDPHVVDKLEIIRHNSKYLLALLDDILDLSKIEAGKLNLEEGEIDVSQLMEDIRSLMDVRANQEQIPLVFEWNAMVPARITGDMTRVRQILVNLIGNALKFTEKGEVRVSTRLREIEMGAELDFIVTDTGIGMSKEHLAQIFQPFTQADAATARQFGGTGLGLSISKRLAEAMGGTLAVESEEGVGSCFTLSLRVGLEQMETLVALDRSRPQKPTMKIEFKAPKLQARILLADDRRDVWRVSKYFLEGWGAEVTIAENGQLAVDAAKNAKQHGLPFDLIIMDMQMPVMSGREAVEELRRQAFDTPIIALTADAMEGERQNCLSFGCDDYMSKPIEPWLLAEKVSRLLTCLDGDDV